MSDEQAPPVQALLDHTRKYRRKAITMNTGSVFGIGTLGVGARPYDDQDGSQYKGNNDLLYASLGKPSGWLVTGTAFVWLHKEMTLNVYINILDHLKLGSFADDGVQKSTWTPLEAHPLQRSPLCSMSWSNTSTCRSLSLASWNTIDASFICRWPSSTRSRAMFLRLCQPGF